MYAHIRHTHDTLHVPHSSAFLRFSTASTVTVTVTTVTVMVTVSVTVKENVFKQQRKEITLRVRMCFYTRHNRQCLAFEPLCVCVCMCMHMEK
jgi:hypothetical protein